jgi:hypothetical protein
MTLGSETRMSCSTRSRGRKVSAGMTMQGSRNKATPDGSPRALMQTSVLMMPTIGSMTRPAKEDRRAIAGTRQNRGVESSVNRDGQKSLPTNSQT